MKVEARNIEVGYMLDLEGDPYADPPDNSTNMLEYMYVEAAKVVHETPECTVIYIDGYDAVGFPANHEIEVVGKNIEMADIT
jgi:hypothetical protein